MHFTSTVASLLLALSATTFAQDASLSSYEASISASISAEQSSISSEVASATSDASSLDAIASSVVYSLTHCNPSFASWYHSVTSVLATETNLASISALEVSLESSAYPSVTACDVNGSAATAYTLATTTATTDAGSAAGSTATAAGASATSSTASTGAGSLFAPAMGLGGLVFGVAVLL